MVQYVLYDERACGGDVERRTGPNERLQPAELVVADGALADTRRTLQTRLCELEAHGQCRDTRHSHHVGGAVVCIQSAQHATSADCRNTGYVFEHRKWSAEENRHLGQCGLGDRRARVVGTALKSGVGDKDAGDTADGGSEGSRARSLPLALEEIAEDLGFGYVDRRKMLGPAHATFVRCLPEDDLVRRARRRGPRRRRRTEPIQSGPAVSIQPQLAAAAATAAAAVGKADAAGRAGGRCQNGSWIHEAENMLQRQISLERCHVHSIEALILLFHRLLHCQTRSNPHHGIVCAREVELVRRRRGARHLRRKCRIGRRDSRRPRDMRAYLQVRHTLNVASSQRHSLRRSSLIRRPLQTLRRHPVGRETTITAQLAERCFPVFV